MSGNPKNFTDLFVYNYDRPYPDREVDPRRVFTVLFFAAPAVALSPFLLDALTHGWSLLRSRFDRTRRAGPPGYARPEEPQDRKIVVASLAGLAAVFAIYLGWFHFRALSPHWTQRDLFWEYYQQSTPDEPIGAYLMNWRGETFYSRNQVRQLKDQTKLQEFVAGPGTFEENGSPAAGGGGVAVWAPPRPTLDTPLTFSHPDVSRSRF